MTAQPIDSWPDRTALNDLAEFARIEVESKDVEPWADIIRHLYLSQTLNIEQTLWLIRLYTAYDDLGSAVAIYARWPGPYIWRFSPDFGDAAAYPLTNERRGLRGGKVVRNLADYCDHLAGDLQSAWLRRDTIGMRDPHARWDAINARMRRVWGVGRQTAFEWCEFVTKVLGWDAEPRDADLWESEGPRRSLQRLYGLDRPSAAWLDARAIEGKQFLHARGVDVKWVDFETIICDFEVQRQGRYYPGRHLAALREEITGMPEPWRRVFEAAWRAVIPPPWSSIKPGIDKSKLTIYRDTGRIVDKP